jgi:hypothetical protein
MAGMASLGILLIFWKGRVEPAESAESGTGLRQLIGCSMVMYAILLTSFLIAVLLFLGSAFDVWRGLLLASVAFIAIVFGTLVNVNYLGIHRMYRDRLMELFLPTPDAVLSNTWQFASSADTADVPADVEEGGAALLALSR